MHDIVKNERTLIGFSGGLGRFAGLVFVNLLLTIMTIGVYRFWAKTRVRRHLWERTTVLGEPLEYRGRGIEKFVGALLVFATVFIPLLIISIAAAVLRARHETTLAFLLYGMMYIGLLYLFGVGLYRAQRYRFSRTAWRGIRGGMTGGGWAYGGQYLKLLLLSVVTLGFASPYVSTQLWNRRMSDARFGTFMVTADAEWRPVYRRFLLVWLGALLVYAIAAAIIYTVFGGAFAAFKPGAPPPADPKLLLAMVVRIYAVLIAVGLIIGLLMLNYYAALLRELFGKTRLDTLGFDFDATPGDLLKFMLGNVVLVVVTLGFGVLLMPYRVWSLYARHLATVGGLDVDRLLQTTLAAPVQGDGLADAFDVASF